MHRICVLVCGNGLGHFRRVVPVLAAAPTVRTGKTAVEIVCARWQREAMARWSPFRALTAAPGVSFSDYEPPLGWPPRRQFLQAADPMAWVADLERFRLDRFDLVLSDNAVEVLTLRPDALLMGSFLWHDVYAGAFPDDPAVRRYAEGCKELLGRHRPSMIVNRYFAMPAALRQTRAERVGMLPPVVPPDRRRGEPRSGVLVVGGTNARVAESLARHLVSGASSRTGRPIRVDGRLAGEVEGAGVEAFDFDVEPLSSLEAVVARPGMGIITDAVSSETPILCIADDSPEMRHNARRVRELGVGAEIEPDADPLDAVDRYLASKAEAERRRAAWDEISREGLPETVRFLERRLAEP